MTSKFCDVEREEVMPVPFSEDLAEKKRGSGHTSNTKHALGFQLSGKANES